MNSNNTAYLKEENILSLISLNNMIIPEIQREYVWGETENKKVLESFLDNIKNNVKPCNDCGKVHKIQDINVGFLYSYKPPYITLDKERYLDEFLIDGQQRFTTLFLLLLYLAIKERRINDFLTIVRFNADMEEISFDYKVRNLTHRFLIDLLNCLNENSNWEDLYPIEKQTWFLSDYKSDITIQAMLGALKFISEKFNDHSNYFDYILTSIRFWHFKTEATSQGEELYITMNSRGEKLSGNEQEKAQILKITDDKLFTYGRKWEEWQDYFWKRRDKNENADKGFNDFIRWIKELEKNNPNIESIEKYFNIVEFLFDENFGIFKEKLKWLAPIDELNQIGLFQLLPVIKFVERFGFETDLRKIKRVKEFFKNLTRIKNVRKSITNLLPESIEIINNLPNDDIASILDIEKVSSQILSKEEKIKFEIYTNPNYIREELENVFWNTEKHPIWSGEILPIINWATTENRFDFDLFQKYNKTFNQLFHDKCDYTDLDVTRRALLTIDLNEYPKIFIGNTNYNFCRKYSDWQTIINGNVNKFGKFIKDLTNNGINYRIKMIENNPNDKNFDEFVKIEELLAYCKQKNIQWNHDTESWILIEGQNRRGRYANLYSYRLYLDFNANPFWNNNWKIDFYPKETTCAYFDYSKENIAVDIYYEGQDFWRLEFFNRDNASEDQRKYLDEVANKLSLMKPENSKRYKSTQNTKENVITLLKNIFDTINQDDNKI